jgi:hypothetical protein
MSCVSYACCLLLIHMEGELWRASPRLSDARSRWPATSSCSLSCLWILVNRHCCDGTTRHAIAADTGAGQDPFQTIVAQRKHPVHPCFSALHIMSHKRTLWPGARTTMKEHMHVRIHANLDSTAQHQAHLYHSIHQHACPSRCNLHMQESSTQNTK